MQLFAKWMGGLALEKIRAGKVRPFIAIWSFLLLGFCVGNCDTARIYNDILTNISMAIPPHPTPLTLFEWASFFSNGRWQ